MARELTKQEEVDQARLRLKLLAQKHELEAELRRRQARNSFSLAALPGAGGKLPGLAVTAGGALLAVAAGMLLARQPKLRAPALALLTRMLTR